MCNVSLFGRGDAGSMSLQENRGLCVVGKRERNAKMGLLRSSSYI